MTRAVLSIGSNLGDRLGHLRSVVDGLGEAVIAVSPVYETDPWGGVDQGPFLNAVVIADDAARDALDWLRRGQALERDADRVRETHWGPRTLDVDVIACRDGEVEVTHHDDVLTVPHPYAHQRAFVLVPWLAADAEATLLVGDAQTPVAALVDGLDAAERAAVRPTGLVLTS